MAAKSSSTSSFGTAVRKGFIAQGCRYVLVSWTFSVQCGQLLQLELKTEILHLSDLKQHIYVYILLVFVAFAAVIYTKSGFIPQLQQQQIFGKYIKIH